ncbi:hypothetical protein JAAARDRAFT_119427, partial [Jaapia argillacea MUCL 33604]
PCSTLPRPLGGEIQCFACNEKGYMMNTCGKLNEVLTKGLAYQDENGRVVLADGSWIRQVEGENLIVAIERSIPVVNFVTCGMERSEMQLASTNVVEIGQGKEMEVYPVIRTEQKSANHRQEVMDGVYLPPKPEWAQKIDKGKGKETEMRIAPPNSPPAPPAVIINTPIDIHPQPAFDSEDSDSIMEDPVPSRMPISPKICVAQTDLVK